MGSQQNYSKMLFGIIISFIATALVVGGITYFWQNKVYSEQIGELKNEIEKLKSQVEDDSHKVEDDSHKKEQVFKTPDISFEEDPMKSLKIKNHGTQVEEIMVDKPIDPIIFKQTRDNVYIKLSPSDLGGYYTYPVWAVVYKLNLENNKLTVVNEKSNNKYNSLMDISLDESKYLIRSSDSRNRTTGKISFIVKDAQTDSIIRRFQVPEKYKTAGAGLFSPNEKKISFAAAVGDPRAEESAYFVGNIETGELKMISKEKGEVFSSGEWKNNNKLRYFKY